MKFGFSYATNRMYATTQRAFVGFDGVQTADLQNPGTTGSGLASFLLGVPSGSERADAPGSMTPGKVIGVFFQDQWKVNKRLTINVGLRYDANILPNFGDSGFFSSDLHVENQYSGNMNLLRGWFLLPKAPPSCASKGSAPCIPTPDGSLPAHVEVAPNGRLFQNNYDNWQPRLGIAYTITPRTVFRAGYGRYFDSWSETVLAAEQQEGLWPDVRRISNFLLNRTTVEARSANPLALAGKFPAANPFSLTTTGRDPYMGNAYSDQYNVGFEQQLSQSAVLTMNFVGSRGRRIPTGSIWNVAFTPGPGDPVQRRPYPYINPASVIRDWSRNWYDSLQETVDQRFSRGLSYIITYTWSKALDLGSSDGFGGSAMDAYNLRLEKGPSNSNLPHVFSLASVYELPLGKGNLQSGLKPVDYIVRD